MRQICPESVGEWSPSRRLMKRTFAWRDVSKPILVFAVTVTIVAVWGIASPGFFGGQPLTLPFTVTAAALLDFAAYWSGTSPVSTRQTQQEQSTEGLAFQEYMQAAEQREAMLEEARTASRSSQGEEKFDVRV